MRSGPRDRHIEIQFEDVSKDEFQAEVKTWKKLHECWARLVPVKGEERLKTQAVIGRQILTFSTLWLPGVNQRCRVIYDNETYDIFDYSEIGRREGMQLICLLINGNEHAS